MPTLQVRDLPEDVYRRLQDLANSDHRSLAQETVVLLRDAIGARYTPRQLRQTALAAMPAVKLSNGKTFPDPAALIREDRDR